MLEHSISITHLFPTVSIYQIFTETNAVLCYEVCSIRCLCNVDVSISCAKVAIFSEIRYTFISVRIGAS